MGSVKQDRIALRTHSRRERAVQLRRDGRTYQDIGRELGVNRSTVMRLLRAAFAMVPVADVEATRALLDARYERIAEVAANHMASHNAETALQAAAVATRNNRALAALHGLESNELRVKPMVPTETGSGIDTSRLEPPDLTLLLALVNLSNGTGTRDGIVAAARAIVAAENAKNPPIALLPQHASPASPGAFGPRPPRITEVDDEAIVIG